MADSETPSSEESFEDLIALAEAGDPDAQYNLGVMYANGHGVTQDDTEAVRWYRLAADQGYARGQAFLGFIYRKFKNSFPGALRATSSIVGRGAVQSAAVPAL